uniref:Putative conserved secreted protein n=1 Tax=Ixodes ricinus TaxID=34613 RepID=A0A6B0UQ63_IXORI
MSVFMIIMGLVTFLHDAEAMSGNWYLDENLTHMPEECKKDLKNQFSKECEKIGGKFTKFEVCQVQCMIKNANFYKNQPVMLKDGLPCGPYGEKCRVGLCRGPCDVEFFNQVKPRSNEDKHKEKRDLI